MLMRYDPFRELDRFTDQLFGSPTRTPWVPMDAVRHDGTVEVRLDLPGVAPESIDVTVERNVLTVKAERSWWPAEGDEILARERPQGSFSRQLLLGDALDGDHIDARYEHGVLSVTIPVAEKAKARKVEVRTSAAPVEVTAGS